MTSEPPSTPSSRRPLHDDRSWRGRVHHVLLALMFVGIATGFAGAAARMVAGLGGWSSGVVVLAAVLLAIALGARLRQMTPMFASVEGLAFSESDAAVPWSSIEQVRYQKQGDDDRWTLAVTFAVPSGVRVVYAIAAPWVVSLLRTNTDGERRDVLRAALDGDAKGTVDPVAIARLELLLFQASARSAWRTGLAVLIASVLGAGGVAFSRAGYDALIPLAVGASLGALVVLAMWSVSRNTAREVEGRWVGLRREETGVIEERACSPCPWLTLALSTIIVLPVGARLDRAQRAVDESEPGAPYRTARAERGASVWQPSLIIRDGR